MKNHSKSLVFAMFAALPLLLSGCLNIGDPTNPEATDLPDDQIHAPGSQQASVRLRNYNSIIPAATPVPAQYFVDPLPIPAVAQSAGLTAAGQPLYKMNISQFSKFLGFRDAAGNKVMTTVLGYNNQYPGPTIAATQNKPIAVDFTNNLPATPLFPVDHNLHGANKGEPDNRTITHHHGGNNAAADDGFPTSWNTPGQTRRHIFTNNQAEMTTWYHDHPAGITRYNVYAGLAGAYLINPATAQPGFRPAAAQDIPLIVQDKIFTATGQLDYPGSATWSPELIGDRLLVNGMMYPYLNVDSRTYRFRIVNASNARFYNFKLVAGGGAFGTTKALNFDVVASDAGMLPQAKSVTSLLVAPGERFEILVNFQLIKSQGYSYVTMANDANAPYPNGLAVTPEVANVMRFNINKTSGLSLDPLIVSNTNYLNTADIAATNQTTTGKIVRNISLEEVLDPTGAPIMLTLNGAHFSDPVTELPKAGSKEVWNFINVSADTHPMHMHAMRFKVISRRPFDVAAYLANKTINYIGASIGPSVSETGWKDTVKAHPGEITTVVADFGTYAGDFVFHCHILEHEDNDMMRPLRVVP